MTDRNIKEALARSYAIPDLDEATADRIKRNAMAPAPRVRRGRVWRSVIFVGALAAASAYAFPIVNANLFALELARKLNPPEAYTMILQADGATGPGQELEIYRGAIAAVEAPGVTYYIDEKGIGRAIETDQRVAVNQGSAADSLLLMPRKIIPFLSVLNASRRLTHLPDGQIGGRPVSRYRLVSDEKTVSIEIALYNDTGELADFRWTPQEGTKLPVTLDLHMRFVYDSARARLKFDQIAKSYDHEIIQANFDKLAAELSGRVLAKAKVGTDTVTIHSFERLNSGAVFLLYSLGGTTFQSQFPFVRLRDRAGHQWLPDSVQLSQDHLIGEILYPPVGIDTVPTHLWVMASTSGGSMEMLPDMRFQPMHEPGYTPLQVADLTPAPIARVPDWFFLKMAFVGWFSFRNYGAAMQLNDLVERKQFASAVKVGEELLPNVAPDDHIHLGTRRRVLLGLAMAYSALGEHEPAKRHLKELTQELVANPGEEGEFLKAFRDVCHREGLAIPAAADP